jgi:hypothetical protein
MQEWGKKFHGEIRAGSGAEMGQAFQPDSATNAVSLERLIYATPAGIELSNTIIFQKNAVAVLAPRRALVWREEPVHRYIPGN